MDMSFASCATTTRDNGVIMCFPNRATSQCIRGADPFSISLVVDNANYGHHGTYVASSDEFVLAVGTWAGRGQTATELLSTTTWKWSVVTPYPFEPSIYWARIVHFNASFFLFGGKNGSTGLSRIASYSPVTNQWISRGQLLTRREYAGVIWDGDAFIVIGGWIEAGDDGSSEKCHFVGEQIECEYQTPVLPLGTV